MNKYIVEDSDSDEDRRKNEQVKVKTEARNTKVKKVKKKPAARKRHMSEVERIAARREDEARAERARVALCALYARHCAGDAAKQDNARRVVHYYLVQNVDGSKDTNGVPGFEVLQNLLRDTYGEALELDAADAAAYTDRAAAPAEEADGAANGGGLVVANRAMPPPPPSKGNGANGSTNAAGDDSSGPPTDCDRASIPLTHLCFGSPLTAALAHCS